MSNLFFILFYFHSMSFWSKMQVFFTMYKHLKSNSATIMESWKIRNAQLFKTDTVSFTPVMEPHWQTLVENRTTFLKKKASTSSVRVQNTE